MRWSTPSGLTTLGPAPYAPLRGHRTGARCRLPLPEVAWRGGIDLNPLDVTDPDAMRWLETLVWPEQDDRRERLRHAIDVARADPPRLVRGDLLDELPALVAEAAAHGDGRWSSTAPSRRTCPLEDRDAHRSELMHGLVADGRCHWVSNEATGRVPGAGRAGPAAVEVPAHRRRQGRRVHAGPRPRAPVVDLDLDLKLSHGWCKRSASTPSARPRTSSSRRFPTCSPGSGQVRIGVEASGVHLLDTTLRRGEAGPVPLPELPTVPGREVAGVVDVVGPDTDRSWLGQRVVAHLGQVPGGYAEQAVTARGPRSSRCPTTSRSRMRWPRSAPAARRWGSWSWSRPLPTTSCWCRRPPVGWAGCSCSPPSPPGRQWWPPARGPRTDVLADLGVALVVDYGRPGWAERVRADLGGVTLVYDGVGGDVGPGLARAARPGGRLVMFGFSAGDADRGHHRRPGRPRDHRRLVAGPADDGAARAAFPGSPAAPCRRSPPGNGGHWSRRSRWRMRPARTPTSRSAGRWARSSLVGRPLNSVEAVGPDRADCWRGGRDERAGRRAAVAARPDAVPPLRPTGGWPSRSRSRRSPSGSGWSAWSGRSSGSAAARRSSRSCRLPARSACCSRRCSAASWPTGSRRS